MFVGGQVHPRIRPSAHSLDDPYVLADDDHELDESPSSRAKLTSGHPGITAAQRWLHYASHVRSIMAIQRFWYPASMTYD